MRDLHIVEMRCRTILNCGTFGEGTYTLNAYQGCAFACSYCYVPHLRHRRGQVDDRPWGGWLLVKVNAPDVLRRQMLNVAESATIMIGTATDSWQPAEKRYGVSRRILEELAYYPNHVSIISRSPLLIRDIDVLRRMADVSVNISLPTFDERARRVFEPHAPSVAGRCEAVRRLAAAGVRVGLLWCPILPGVSDTAAGVRAYVEQAAALGVRRIGSGTMGYLPAVGPRHAELLAQFRAATGEPALPSLPRAALMKEVQREAARCGIRCAA